MTLIELGDTTVKLEMTHVELMVVMHAVNWTRFQLPKGDHHPVSGASLEEVVPIAEELTAIWRRVPRIPPE